MRTSIMRVLSTGRRAVRAMALAAPVAMAVVATSCQPEPPDVIPAEAPAQADGVATPAAPIQTGARSYTLGRVEGGWERTLIDFVFRNRGADTLYQPTCRANGEGKPGLSLVVQEQVDERWEDVWHPMLLGCLSEPIVVPPGGAYRDTFEVNLHPQDTVTQPRLNTEVPVDGTYRLRWDQLLRTYDADAYPFGEEAAESLRISNPFTLTRPEHGSQ